MVVEPPTNNGVPPPNPAPSNRAPELPMEAPVESTSRRKTNWESIDNLQIFPDLDLASEFLDDQPFMHFVRTQTNRSKTLVANIAVLYGVRSLFVDTMRIASC